MSPKGNDNQGHHFSKRLLLELNMLVQVRGIGMRGEISSQQRGPAEGLRVPAQQTVLGRRLGRELSLLPGQGKAQLTPTPSRLSSARVLRIRS